MKGKKSDPKVSDQVVTLVESEWEKQFEMMDKRNENDQDKKDEDGMDTIENEEQFLHQELEERGRIEKMQSDGDEVQDHSMEMKGGRWVRCGEGRCARLSEINSSTPRTGRTWPRIRDGAGY